MLHSATKLKSGVFTLIRPLSMAVK